MAYVIYVAVKLISYIAWCWVGLRLWRAESASFSRAGMLGLFRLTIGVVFGVAIFFFAGSIQPERLIWKYIAIYTPVRMVEWFILALVMGMKSDTQAPHRLVLWCLGGIVVSFAADFASPEGVAGHFCVGRCLC
jgi:hypothetical protein